MLAILLALGTALGYGVANYLAPVLGRRMPLAVVLLGGQLAGLVVSLAVTAGADVTMDGPGLAFAIAAGATNAGALACFYRAGRTGDLSVLSPITSSGAIVPVLVGLATGDRPSAVQLAGIPVVLIGIALAARRPRMATGPGATAPASRGLGWALLAALLFGAFLTTYAEAAADSSPGALLWSRVALLSGTAVGVLVLRAPVRARPRDGALTAVPGLLLALGTFAFGEASRVGLLSVVSVIATLNPVITVGLAFLLLHERPSRTQRIGAALALVGIGLLAAGQGP
ncbi:EamA family transporter [Pseudonocardia humida]|uniref:EamA family transporter n=1 Tax=Pseudonocardia humida TaxID=2800819 RepID=A0ABT1A309_9PSEU|nr:EamA family transporter [Pseudonocardia humida]MCO1657375.1 EamA family transporter [Pseudonocardia humida]